jgi:hypothetical protein
LPVGGSAEHSVVDVVRKSWEAVKKDKETEKKKNARDETPHTHTKQDARETKLSFPFSQTPRGEKKTQ